MPVHTVGAPLSIIFKVIPPIPNGQMGWVKTSSVMAKMSDDLMAIRGEPISNAVDEPISSVLTIHKPNLTRLSRSSNHTAILIGRSICQQLVNLG